jgi:hypothetical protein
VLIRRHPKRYTIKPPVGTQIHWGHPLAQGLRHCFAAAEGGGNKIVDIARNYGADGAGTVGSWVTSSMGVAYKGNNSAYFKAPTNITGAITHEIWFIPNTTTNQGLMQLVDGTVPPSSPSEWDRTLYTDGSGKPTFWVWDGAAVQKIAGASALVASTLYQVVAVSTGANIFLYVNAAQVATAATVQSAAGAGPNYCTFGWATADDSSNYFNDGTLILGRTWDRGLSAKEVQDLYMRPWGMFEGGDNPRVRAVSVSNVTTTQTQPATARITVTTTKTQTAISRITATTAKTQTDAARITARTTQTTTDVARITVTGVAQTQTGTSRLAVTANQAQTADTRITKTGQTQTEAAVARITATGVQQTQAGTSRVRATTQKTSIAVSRVTKTGRTQSQGAVTRVYRVGQTATQSDTARIYVVGTQKLTTARAAIVTPSTQHQQYQVAGARIVAAPAPPTDPTAIQGIYAPARGIQAVYAPVIDIRGVF